MTSATTASTPLVGTWKLVSFQFKAEGGNERHDVYDEHPNGFLVITAERRMMALLTAGDRTLVARIGPLFDRMIAYSGRYRLQGDDRFVTIIDSAWHPAWVGTKQTRYIKLDGDTLTLTSPPQEHPKFPGQRVRDIAIWVREEPVF